MNRIEAKERMKAALRMIVQGARTLTQIESEVIDEAGAHAERQEKGGGESDRRYDTSETLR
jgi:hypothetical protein